MGLNKFISACNRRPAAENGKYTVNPARDLAVKTGKVIIEVIIGASLTATLN